MMASTTTSCRCRFHNGLLPNQSDRRFGSWRNPAARAWEIIPEGRVNAPRSFLFDVFLQAGGQMTWPNLMGSNSALCAKIVRPSVAVRKCLPLLGFAVALGCCTHDDVSSRIGCPALKNIHKLHHRPLCRAAPDAGCGSCFLSRA